MGDTTVYKSPHFKWADTKTDLFITVTIPEVDKKSTVSNLTANGELHLFTSKTRKKKTDPTPELYCLDLELFGKVNVEV